MYLTTTNQAEPRLRLKWQRPGVHALGHPTLRNATITGLEGTRTLRPGAPPAGVPSRRLAPRTHNHPPDAPHPYPSHQHAHRVVAPLLEHPGRFKATYIVSPSLPSLTHHQNIDSHHPPGTQKPCNIHNSLESRPDIGCNLIVYRITVAFPYNTRGKTYPQHCANIPLLLVRY